MTHENIQNLWTDITVHMLHILQQFGKDYITGKNTNRWKNNVLTHSRLQLSFYYFFFNYLLRKIAVKSRRVYSQQNL